tara:strand:+ start:840 stop:2309 length:1470 start_codon:yes stop_codon:yes gene_type:complete
MSWDETYYHEIGEVNLKYLLSFGQINEAYLMKERFSTLYWSIASFINQIFPKKLELEIYHLINTFFGLMTIVGLYKINKILFNKEVARIASLFIFLTPFFFGHFAINNKDIILAFVHVWIIYYIYKYTFSNYNFNKRIYILIKMSLLAAVGTGIQLLFLGSLIPIILLFLIILLFYKKIKITVILFDLIIFLALFYSLLVLFWVDIHSNILFGPFEILTKTFSMSLGWPFNLLNGVYYNSNNLPFNYILINYLYKLPEFLIFLYLISVPILFLKKDFVIQKFKDIKVILFSVILLLAYPSFVMLIIPHSIYDGLRLFLWGAPYLIIIPSITTYLIFINNNFYFNSIKFFLIILILLHIFNFLTITPYHYTYLNIFSGEKDGRYKKFENDYWSTSLKELILSSNLGDGKINFHSCGVSPEITKIYMKEKYNRSEYTIREKASYIIMTNRTVYSKNNKKITNCYDEYKQENVHQISRNGIILSAIKKINNE